MSNFTLTESDPTSAVSPSSTFCSCVCTTPSSFSKDTVNRRFFDFGRTPGATERLTVLCTSRFGRDAARISSVADVFRKAREADVAVVGVGSILTDDSSYYDLHPSSNADRQAIEKSGATGELLAHLIDRQGKLCNYSLNRSLVSLTLDEFATIPRSIGIASGPSKVAPILSAMRGNHLDTIVTDEATGLQILELAQQEAA